MQEKPILGITMGDASGAGPEMVVKALTQPHVHAICRPIVIGDAATFRQASQVVGSRVPIHASAMWPKQLSTRTPSKS